MLDDESKNVYFIYFIFNSTSTLQDTIVDLLYFVGKIKVE